MTSNIFTQSKTFNADVHTPVELYLQLRHNYRKTCLLESNDYFNRQDSNSILGLNPIVEIVLKDGQLSISSEKIQSVEQIPADVKTGEFIQKTLNSFCFPEDSQPINGFFGRVGFEFSLFDEDQLIHTTSDLDLPDLHLFIYQYIVVIDHFTDEGMVIKNSFLPEPLTSNEMDLILHKNSFVDLPFETLGEEKTNRDDHGIEQMVLEAKKHVERGDVFQLVVSNRYSQNYFGDDFKVYRSLRRLNPSPYLFYFDFEGYRLFGSSPEAQLKIKAGRAEIHPIAGTVKKTGDAEVDAKLASELLADEKENAEHTMLVDLARNDLSRSCTEVKVEKYKQLQGFSHVQHLVSVVSGELACKKNSFLTFQDTFPAGTLSGTPKPKALELIQKLENNTRDFYGGAIGLISCQGDINMAIVIRSVLSQNGKLYYRAGAGVVLDSEPAKEVEEIHIKLGAVRKAIKEASRVENKIIELI